jgi:transposase-like protein
MRAKNYEGRLSVVEWQKIKAEYISGNTSYRKLAEKHGISFNTLKDRAVAEQWYELRQQNHNKTTTRIVKANQDKDVKKAVDIIDVADKLLAKVEQVMDTMVVDTQSLKQLTSALKDLRDIKGIKSEADMREQEARIEKLRKEAQSDTEENREVTVIFDDDLEKYSK